MRIHVEIEGYPGQRTVQRVRRWNARRICKVRGHDYPNEEDARRYGIFSVLLPGRYCRRCWEPDPEDHRNQAVAHSFVFPPWPTISAGESEQEATT